MDEHEFVQLVLERSSRKSKIEHFVEKHWELIDAGLGAKASLGAIRSVLLEMEDLKCSKSGFNTAVSKVRDRKKRGGAAGRGDSRYSSTF